MATKRNKKFLVKGRAEAATSDPLPKKSFHLSACTQNIYTRPGFDKNDKLTYVDTDSAPFLVHVTLKDTDAPSSPSLKALRFAQLLVRFKWSWPF